MPESKKRVKSGKKRRRDRDGASPAAASSGEVPSGGGGFLGKMRGGIQTVAGAAPSRKKESLLSKVLTWALVLLAAILLARRFGILR